MKKLYSLLFLAVSLVASSQSIFINEIHYENTGSDTGEFVEIAAPAGTVLDGYRVVLYNGNDGRAYASYNLAGTAVNQMNTGYGFYVVNVPETPGMQNGAPDGLALVAPNGTVIQFLSYEGSFEATDGAAKGMTSTDIGVSETSSTPVGYSLQLQGTGTNYSQFTWTKTPITATPGLPNTNQIFSVLSVSDVSTKKIEFVKNTIVDNFVVFGTKAEVKLYDANGQLVKSAVVQKNGELNVSSLPAGIYIVVGEVDGQNVSEKIIKK